MTLGPVTLTASSSGQAAVTEDLGYVTNDTSESFTPTISITGVPGLSLSNTSETLEPSGMMAIDVTGLQKLAAGSYQVTVTLNLGNFTESSTDAITVNAPPSPSPSGPPVNSAISGSAPPSSSPSS